MTRGNAQSHPVLVLSPRRGYRKLMGLHSQPLLCMDGTRANPLKLEPRFNRSNRTRTPQVAEDQTTRDGDYRRFVRNAKQTGRQNSPLPRSGGRLFCCARRTRTEPECAAHRESAPIPTGSRDDSCNKSSRAACWNEGAPPRALDPARAWRNVSYRSKRHHTTKRNFEIFTHHSGTAAMADREPPPRARNAALSVDSKHINPIRNPGPVLPTALQGLLAGTPLRFVPLRAIPVAPERAGATPRRAPLSVPGLNRRICAV